MAVFVPFVETRSEASESVATMLTTGTSGETSPTAMETGSEIEAELLSSIARTVSAYRPEATFDQTKLKICSWLGGGAWMNSMDCSPIFTPLAKNRTEWTQPSGS